MTGHFSKKSPSRSRPARRTFLLFLFKPATDRFLALTPSQQEGFLKNFGDVTFQILRFRVVTLNHLPDLRVEVVHSSSLQFPRDKAVIDLLPQVLRHSYCESGNENDVRILNTKHEKSKKND